RVGVHDAGDGVVVDVAVARGDELDASDALFFGFVREHRAADDVADGVDARDVGREVVVDDHDAARAHGDADLVETEAVRVRYAAHREQHTITTQRLAAFDVDHTGAVLAGRAEHTRAEPEFEPLALENALRELRDFLVHAGQNAVEIFDHGHVRAQPRPDG